MTTKLEHLLEFKKLIQTTNLQQGYQELTNLFRQLRITLAREFSNYSFSGNIVENNMDYAYFQFTDKTLKKKGLKIVIAFIYKDFAYEIWLSGYNRKIQQRYYERFRKTESTYSLTPDPSRTDYILKTRISNNTDFQAEEKLISDIIKATKIFIDDIQKTI